MELGFIVLVSKTHGFETKGGNLFSSFPLYNLRWNRKAEQDADITLQFFGPLLVDYLHNLRRK